MRELICGEIEVVFGLFLRFEFQEGVNLHQIFSLLQGLSDLLRDRHFYASQHVRLHEVHDVVDFLLLEILRSVLLLAQEDYFHRELLQLPQKH